MSENEIAVLCFMMFCAGFYFGTQAKGLKDIWQFIAEKLIYKLWFSSGVDSIKCHSGELVFIEEIEIKGSVDNGKENQQ